MDVCTEPARTSQKPRSTLYCTSEVTVCLHHKSQLMLYVEIMAVCCQRHVGHKLCTQNGRF
jgi:hypothetical protein